MLTGENGEDESSGQSVDLVGSIELDDSQLTRLARKAQRRARKAERQARRNQRRGKRAGD